MRDRKAEGDRVALVDLDGTIADYDAALVEAMRSIQDPNEKPYENRYEETTKRSELPHVEARRKMIQRQPGFWRNLPGLTLGFDIVSELRELGFALHVLTKGPRNNGPAWGEKLEWARENIHDATVTVTGDKSIVFGRVLVDDYPPYFISWLENRPRGLVVCVAHPWNEAFKRGGNNEHPNVVRYDGSNLDEVARMLKRAYDRAPGEPL